MKVAFIGNCQAQLMQSWVGGQATEVTIVEVPAVWLLAEEDRARLLVEFDSCDYIFTQRLSDSMGAEFVRTSFLSEKYPETLVIWPNIYFDGYFPGLGYRYDPSGRKYLGPLDEYHLPFVRRMFESGATSAETCAVLIGDRLLESYPDPVIESLTQLSTRENNVDVGISDYLAVMFSVERTMFSMNHPTNATMLEMLRRLFGFVGERRRLASLVDNPYPLDKVVVPVLPAVSRRYRLGFEHVDLQFKGLDFEARSGRIEVLDQIRYYGPQDLIDAYYRCYAIECQPEARELATA